MEVKSPYFRGMLDDVADLAVTPLTMVESVGLRSIGSIYWVVAEIDGLNRNGP